MKIGFIGYGNMAQALSKRWATTQEIFIGGRNAESAADLAKKINASACIVIKFLFSGRDLRTVLNLVQPEVKPV